MITFLFATNLTISQYEGALINQDDNWFIQTETGPVQVHFGTDEELSGLVLVVTEHENISAQCAFIEDKLTVISYSFEQEKKILRDAEGKILSAVSSRGYQVDTAACIGCNICPSRCPTGALTMVKRKAVIDADLCIDCGICVDICPVNAISVGE